MASAGVRASLPPTLTHAYHPKLHSNYQPWKETRFFLACRKQSSVGANGVKVPKMYSLSLQALSREGGSIVQDVQFPADYTELLKQATVATELALKDDKQLLEIEIPTAGLASVPGDAEGGIEMTESMQLIHEYCKRFVPSEKVTKTRIFLPEANEVVFAKKTVFQGSMFKLDYLTKPSLFEDFGFGSKIKMTDRVKPEDQIFLVAYPYFNVNEILVVEELYEEAVRNTERKLIIFNGELDRIRTGSHHSLIIGKLYHALSVINQDYPPFFYPKLAKLSKTFLPKLESVYYIHNFKGQRGGTLFRCYPGPWKVLRKVNGKYVTLHKQESMPTLKEVALDILPSA